MNNKKFYVWTAIGVVILIAIAVLILGGGAATAPAGTSATNPTNTEAPLTHTGVMYTDSGFSPTSLEVTAPTMVVFESSSTKPFELVSADYPNSGPDKCGNTDGSNFDSCAQIMAGTTSSFWAFTFKEKGTWTYYNSLDSSQTGTVTVK